MRISRNSTISMKVISRGTTDILLIPVVVREPNSGIVAVAAEIRPLRISAVNFCLCPTASVADDTCLSAAGESGLNPIAAEPMPTRMSFAVCLWPCVAASRRPGQPKRSRAVMSSATPQAVARLCLFARRRGRGDEAEVLTEDEARRIAVN